MADDHNSARNEDAEFVARQVAELLQRIHNEANIPLPLIMASAHAQIVTILACVVGGQMAAERCLNAAESVRGIRSFAEVELAYTEPEGHA